MSHRPRPALVSPLPLRATLAALAGIVGTLVVSVAAAVAGILLLPIGRDGALVLLVGALGTASVLALVVIHATLRRHGQTWRSLGFAPPTARLLHLMWQLPALLVVLVAVQLVFFVAVLGESGPPSSGDDDLGFAFADLGLVPVVVLAVLVVVVTPVWEEAVFRGLIHGGMRRRVGVLVATAGSALLFAAAHAVPPLIPYYLTAGLAFALLYEFHRTLWAPVAAHVMINGIATSVLVLGVT